MESSKEGDMRKIGGKIVAFSVVGGTDAPKKAVMTPAVSEPVKMHEDISRPEALTGKTYKIKSPTMNSAVYVTINDITLPSGEKRPYEVFVNSKDSTSFQWIAAMTRLMSAVFRKGGDCKFLVEELKSVFDPSGGYFGSGGVFRTSVVAEIGEVIERHLIGLGILGPKQVIAAEELKNAKVCPACKEHAFVVMDGCETCLSCGNSKCG